jgi:hypothetical protein
MRGYEDVRITAYPEYMSAVLSVEQINIAAA